MKSKILIAFVALSFCFAATAEAGPIRNILGRVCNVAKRAAGVSVKAARAPAKVVRSGFGACGSQGQSSACSNGQCSK